jgi:hypothetical protein
VLGAIEVFDAVPPGIRPPRCLGLLDMRLQGIRAGDLVLCDVKGRRFHAEVTATPADADLEVRPLVPAVTYRHVSSRSVREHWRKAGRRATGTGAAQEHAPEIEGMDDALFTLS